MEYPMENKNRRHSRLSVGVGLFLTCLVLTTIIGLFGGLLISNYTHNNYVMYAEKVDTVSAQGEVQREIVASSEEAAAKPDTEAANAAADTQQADAKAGSVSAFKETGAYTKAQIVEMSAPSVVGIDTITTATTNSYWYGYGQSYEVPGSGSGVILTEDGYIATCAHVVDGAKSVKVTLNDDTSYDATIVGTDKQNDIAIIKIEATGLTPAIVGDSETLTVGSEVIAIGNPLGELRGTATAGIISATNRTIEVEGQTMTLVQTDAAISPGNSGGGLFDATGKLIGIVNAKVSDKRQGQRQPGRRPRVRYPRKQRPRRDQRPPQLRLRDRAPLSRRVHPGRDAQEPVRHVVLLRRHPLRHGGEGGLRQRRRAGGHPVRRPDPEAGRQDHHLRRRALQCHRRLQARRQGDPDHPAGRPGDDHGRHPGRVQAAEVRYD